MSLHDWTSRTGAIVKHPTRRARLVTTNCRRSLHPASRTTLMFTTLLALATLAAGSAPAFSGHTSAIASEEPEALTRAWVINAEMNPRDRLLPR